MATVVLPAWKLARVANKTAKDCVVANSALPKVANRHGVYADKDKRRAYMAEYMRQYRKRKKASCDSKA